MSNRFVSAVVFLAAAPALAQAYQNVAPGDQSAISRRLLLEESLESNPFVITPHRPSYLLPLAYNDNLQSPYNPLEIKFQVSFKITLAKNLVGGNSRLFFGYTQTSWWQAYNQAVSSVFRETNHEPELMLSFIHDRKLFGFRSRVLTLGLDHQSNGRSLPDSRSWNRLYADFILERGKLYFSFKPWLRIPEDRRKDPLSSTGDDNPDIEKYMGNFELRSLYYSGPETWGVLLRNNLRHDNRGALQLDYTYPIGEKLRGYVQYFNGYGESLIDYDRHTQRLGIGVMLTNWL